MMSSTGTSKPYYVLPFGVADTEDEDPLESEALHADLPSEDASRYRGVRIPWNAATYLTGAKEYVLRRGGEKISLGLYGSSRIIEAYGADPELIRKVINGDGDGMESKTLDKILRAEKIRAGVVMALIKCFGSENITEVIPMGASMRDDENFRDGILEKVASLRDLLGTTDEQVDLFGVQMPAFEAAHYALPKAQRNTVESAPGHSGYSYIIGDMASSSALAGEKKVLLSHQAGTESRIPNHRKPFTHTQCAMELAQKLLPELRDRINILPELDGGTIYLKATGKVKYRVPYYADMINVSSKSEGAPKPVTPQLFPVVKGWWEENARGFGGGVYGGSTAAYILRIRPTLAQFVEVQGEKTIEEIFGRCGIVSREGKDKVASFAAWTRGEEDSPRGKLHVPRQFNGAEDFSDMMDGIADYVSREIMQALKNNAKKTI